MTGTDALLPLAGITVLALAPTDRADVVISNLAPGSMDRLGLGSEELRRRREDLVVVTISGYGEAGPYRDRKAHDMLVQAESGLCSVTGTPETATRAVPALGQHTAAVLAEPGPHNHRKDN